VSLILLQVLEMKKTSNGGVKASVVSSNVRAVWTDLELRGECCLSHLIPSMIYLTPASPVLQIVPSCILDLIEEGRLICSSLIGSSR
jgi:hypothetical protein